MTCPVYLQPEVVSVELGRPEQEGELDWKFNEESEAKEWNSTGAANGHIQYVMETSICL